ncbi:hypothetical protein TA3x_000377 [Tundrisphaera sp. TA3]|uniref:hypothetical protein n=1 Tax=Tundrisphaera sp. TA3 TaxID=3435775 RepID=UPI003EBC27C5
MTLPAIAKALERMTEIMQEPSVQAMRGLAYNDGEPELIRQAIASLAAIEPESGSHVAREMNRKYMADVVKGAEKAHFMLGRIGFAEVRGIAWVERDRRVVDAGYEAAMQLAGRGK